MLPVEQVRRQRAWCDVNRRDHWERVHQTADLTQVSWVEPTPAVSLRLIETSGLPRGATILDVGGGISTLVDHLLAAGYEISVIDVSTTALRESQRRLGPDAERVEWIEADVTRFESARTWNVWHDRAVLHFLADEQDLAAYRRALRRAIDVGGYAVIATFGPDGPTRCSGLDVRRYSVESLAALLHDHRTPGGAVQQFLYCRFRRVRE
jgi:2-polyprenyl-3-methyl-5-hydroxy-6-metoxy-1,4-benzoquinol methylase